MLTDKCYVTEGPSDLMYPDVAVMLKDLCCGRNFNGRCFPIIV
jgi:hypothetical protein